MATKCKGNGCLLKGSCQLFDWNSTDENAMDHCDPETRECYITLKRNNYETRKHELPPPK